MSRKKRNSEHTEAPSVGTGRTLRSKREPTFKQKALDKVTAVKVAAKARHKPLKRASSGCLFYSDVNKLTGCGIIVPLRLG